MKTIKHQVLAGLLIFVSAASGSRVLHAQDRIFVTSDRLVFGTESNRSASIRLGDLDGDGDLDALVANGRHWPQQNFVFFNQGRSRFSVMQPLGSDRRTTYACEIADLDGDGDLDVVTGNDMALGRILLNDGKGAFVQHAEFGQISSIRSLTLADIDADKDIDIIATSRGRSNQIYLNNGSADFEAGPSFGRGDDSTIDVAVADINSDGHVDLVLANRDQQPNEILFANGQLEFTTGKPYGSGKDQSRAVAVADLNNDGKLDWVVGNVGQANQVFLGDGAGGVLQTVSFGQLDSNTYAIAIADLNNDGKLDVVAANVGQQNSAFFNNGEGTAFVEVPFGQPDAATYGLTTGDLDGDGFVDIAVASSDGLNHFFLNKAARRSPRN